MISGDQVKAALVEIFQTEPKKFPVTTAARLLSEAETSRGITLSAYGFLRYLLGKLGFKIFWRNLGVNQARVSEFAAESVAMRDDFPALLVNASEYLSKVMAKVYDMAQALDRVENMSFPYVLWFLYKGSNNEELAKRYEDEAYETLRCYPDCLKLLPASYQKYGEDLICSRKH